MRVLRNDVAVRLLLLWQGLMILQRLLVRCAPSPVDDDMAPKPTPRVLEAWSPGGVIEGGDDDGFVDNTRRKIGRGAQNGRRVGPSVGGQHKIRPSRETQEYLKGLKAYRRHMERLVCH